jgi:hypothetical protein
MGDEKLFPFILVGGTALALQTGHRISIDLDFFSKENFNENEYSDYLQTQYGFSEDFRDRSTLKGFINNVKIDLISHHYVHVKPIVIIDNIRMASLQDIAAMKINAIHGNGTRVKDFIDIAFLSSLMSLREILDAYSVKYPNTNEVSAVKALNYFDDMNQNEKVQLVQGVFNLNTVKHRISEMTLHPLKIFPELDFTLKNQNKIRR